MTRVLLLVLVLALAVIVPFAIWGKDVEAWLTVQGAAAWMRSFGRWAWVVGLGLIAVDIVLPIPATAVMAAFGLVYGPLIGGFLSVLGVVLAGSIGYGLCRMVPTGTAVRIVGQYGMVRTKAIFERWGGWFVAASRWLPVLPETVSFIAGLSRMPFGRFFIALLCGALPLGFVFAAVGHYGADAPLLSLAVAAAVPVVLWAIAAPYLDRAEI